jgi:hypothetical protein
MELMVCIDGVEHATLPLIDGNDPFNAESERGAFDRAYEAKESNPDAVVTIVVVTDEESDLIDLRLQRREIEFLSESLSLFAGIDEGENWDAERMKRLAQELQDLLPAQGEEF